MSELADLQDLVEALDTIDDRGRFIKLFRLHRLPGIQVMRGHRVAPTDATVAGSVSLRSDEAKANGHRRYWGFNDDEPSVYVDEIHSINDFGWIARTVPFASTEPTTEHTLRGPANPDETVGYCIAIGRVQSNTIAVSLTFDNVSVVEGLHAYAVVSFLHTLAEGGEPTFKAIKDLGKLCDRLDIKHSSDPRFL